MGFNIISRDESNAVLAQGKLDKRIRDLLGSDLVEEWIRDPLKKIWEEYRVRMGQERANEAVKERHFQEEVPTADKYIDSLGRTNACSSAVLAREGTYAQLMHMIAQDKQHDGVLMYKKHSAVASLLPKATGYALAHFVIKMVSKLAKLMQLCPWYSFKLADPANPTDEELIRGQIINLKHILQLQFSATLFVLEKRGGSKSLRLLDNGEMLRDGLTYVAALYATTKLQPDATLDDLTLTYPDEVSKNRRNELVADKKKSAASGDGAVVVTVPAIRQIDGEVTFDGSDLKKKASGLDWLGSVWVGDNAKIITMYNSLMSGEKLTEKKGCATLTKYDETVHRKFRGVVSLKSYNHALKPKKKHICTFQGCGKELSSSSNLTRHQEICKYNPLNQKKAAANVCKEAAAKKAPAKKAPAKKAPAKKAPAKKAPCDEKPRARKVSESPEPKTKRSRRSTTKKIRYHSDADNEDWSDWSNNENVGCSDSEDEY
ncbi:hypothetical protein THAOC_31170 [Thalassiosira oceanica]|uniref:C2H2-type domain-containing protein n=1 Tax=Thalassiosira oceanica TaxID=159749 RepID=K0RC94_THAOC|nr:hypothetical protein THAOC_31170 [Thalassiosira oceanica]|eukprot:EJK49904.1 hypothetical protein THAOC_31170 [Thalassiosira oceanica]